MTDDEASGDRKARRVAMRGRQDVTGVALTHSSNAILSQITIRSISSRLTASLVRS